MNEIKRSKYTGLRLKIILTTLSFSLIPLLALGYTIYHQFEVAYTQRVLNQLQTVADSKRRTIDLFLNERISQIYTLAHTHTFDELKDPKALEQVFNLMQSRSKFYIDLGIIDNEGHHISYTGPYRLQGFNYRDTDWFNQVQRKGFYVSDVFLGFRKFPHFILAVLRREGNSFWIMRATIDSDVFESLVKGVQLGEKGDIFLLNNANILQTSTRSGRNVLDQVPFPKLGRFTGSRTETMNLEGNDFLVATAWLDNLDWLLVLRDDPKVNLLPLAKAQYFLFVIVAGGLVLIIAGTVFLTRLMVNPLIRADREKASLDASLMQSSKMAALGKLAAGVAHEINNPLAIIKEKAGWIRDLLTEEDVAGSANFGEFKESVDKIEYHVERAKNVTHRLLGFARRMEPVSEEVDINAVLSRTITFLENEALYRNISIKTDFQESMPRTTSDISQLQQVFLNILDNGIDSIEKNGTITIQTMYLPETQEIVISIADTGAGIPRDKLEHIFDPFFSTKKVGEGTGLGLTISYSIIEKLGGRITVDSEEGRGATFTIYLPVK